MGALRAHAADERRAVLAGAAEGAAVQRPAAAEGTLSREGLACPRLAPLAKQDMAKGTGHRAGERLTRRALRSEHLPGHNLITEWRMYGARITA